MGYRKAVTVKKTVEVPAIATLVAALVIGCGHEVDVEISEGLAIFIGVVAAGIYRGLMNWAKNKYRKASK